MSGNDEAVAGAKTHNAVNMPSLQALADGTLNTGFLLQERGPAPVHLWNPPFCGDIPMRIGVDGTWFYEGSPITRPAMVRLFASILRKDESGHVLVNPVERVGIAVDDAPFVAVELRAEGAGQAQDLHFRTNLDDWVRADADHPLTFQAEAQGGLKPYLRVRGGLLARVARSVYYELVDLAEAGEDGEITVMSAGTRFPLRPTSA